ncbi:hypothetical protein [Streptomyces sp. WAC04114]|uniref:hypothetical protein n=1 Tax=Streptomyces sp. WAC04114 TaxID=2867961 RepID=UPI001C8BE8FD|nr:hypothetical protein [Streptomyces sp. WAC04114]MBX9361113.1 hypothetical protein [Streptomyces sp. WAC04114]
MQRARRWAVTVFAGAGSFVVCLWSARAAPFGFLPTAEADRWLVATTFATTVTTLVGAAAAWWAGDRGRSGTDPTDHRSPGTSRPPRSATRVRQSATASDAARVTQIAGHTGHAGPEERPDTVTQRATASGRAGITQVGGSDGTRGPVRGVR